MKKAIYLFLILSSYNNGMETKSSNTKRESEELQESLKNLNGIVDAAQDALNIKTDHKMVELKLKCLDVWLALRRDYNEYERRFHYKDESHVQKIYGISLQEIDEFEKFEQRVFNTKSSATKVVSVAKLKDRLLKKKSHN